MEYVQKRIWGTTSYTKQNMWQNSLIALTLHCLIPSCDILLCWCKKTRETLKQNSVTVSAIVKNTDLHCCPSPLHRSLQICCHANKSITDIMVTLICFMYGNLSDGIFANIGFSVFQSGTAVTGELVVMSGSSVAIFCNCNNVFRRVSLITSEWAST